MLILTVALSLAANANGSVYIAPDSATTQWEVESIVLTANTTVASDAVDFDTLRAYKGTGTGTPLVAARASSTAAITAGTPENLTLTAAGNDLVVTQASPFQLASVYSGAGKLLNVSVTVRFRIKRV